MRAFVAVVASALLSLAVAHGGDEGGMKMDMDMGTDNSIMRPTIPSFTAAPNATDALPSYFQHGQYSGWMLSHILLMTFAWVFVLPIAVLFSISRSRYTLPLQFVFLAMNAVGLVCSTIYNANTPDLYPDNAHHKLGWILTILMIVQVAFGVIKAYADRKDAEPYMPVSSEAMAEHQRMQRPKFTHAYRFSNDSGQGTEPNTESLRSQSISSSGGDLSPMTAGPVHEEATDAEKSGLLKGTKVDRFLSKKIPGLLSAKFLRIFHFFYNAVDRLIFLLGFVAFTTGIITYGGIFQDREVFSGLAHFIKGGVFFWYGILTLGRWAGCFADIGWAWNISPSKSRIYSAEFVESFLIFFYGSTNVFLEHLNAWGEAWSAQDLEHISITIMFFGGGLCGMLIESSKIRDLLNVTRVVPSQSHLPYHASDQNALEPPKSYGVSMNPIPALIVLLLGMMMSSHHQESMVSTMIHKQWGTLLVGAAFARAATYVVFYLAPPTSILPGRPPTELITAFCLMAGGMIFMASAHDCVTSMEAYDIDAMFVFTVSMGVITALMAWIILAIAIKGWAVRKEKLATGAGDFGYHGVA